MTYEELYRPAMDRYLEQWEEHFSKFVIRPMSGATILQLQEELENRQAKLTALVQSKPVAFDFDLAKALEERFEDAVKEHAQKIEDVKRMYSGTRVMLQKSYTQRVQEADAAAAAAAEGSITDLTEKYDKLLTYKDKVSDVVLRYGIKPSSLSIDVDTLSREEMEALLDSAISACKFLGEDRLRDKLKVMYEPPAGGTEDDRLHYAVAVLVFTLFLSPIVLFLLFGYMFWHTTKVYKHVDALRIADKLMYGISFSRFKETPEIEEIPEVDLTALNAKELAELQQLEEVDPAKEREQLQQEINKNSMKIAERYRAASSRVLSRYDSLCQLYKDSIADLQKQINTYLANMKEFGSEASASYVMDTQFVLGKQKGMIDIKYDMGLRNVIFADRSPQMLQFIKLLLANAMLSVRPRQFLCTIYDPEGLGADFATFLSKDTMAYISVVTDNFNKVLNGHRAYAQDNLRILDQSDINTFNEEAAKKGMVTLEYRLLIIVSGLEKPTENKLLMEFIQFSARTGALVWLVAPKAVEGCIFYDKPFSGVAEPYPLSSALFNRVMQTYMEAFANTKDAGISYFSSFGDRYLPREKWWSENTDKGIKLNFGLQDGDPSKGFAVELGDAPVHGLCVGATGAGKSAFNNQLLASLVTRYPPSALELILIDFKNVEFASLTDKSTNLSRIPHARIVAGTKDGEYAISVFDFLLADMENRNKVFAAAGCKKIEEYNRKMRTQGTPEKCLPRTLLLIDEFQVMFTEVDPKSVDIIQARIRSLAKLARSAGVHMFFTSQSMKGTMPKDILDQFSLRVALRCSADTSNDIIGSDIASKIKAKFGYLYSNTNMGETQDSTTLWRTPYLAEEDWYDDERLAQSVKAGKKPQGSKTLLAQITQMAEERNERNYKAYFYNEDERWPSSRLTGWLKEHTETVIQEKRLLVLGERTGFSLKKAPVNFKLKRGDGENLFFYAFEEIDFTNLCMTFVDNIRAVPDATLLINCADQDVFTVLDLEEWYDPGLLDIARPMTDVSEWVSTLTDMIEERKEMDPSEYGPLYFMAIRWDKQLGICRDENYKLVDAWKAVLTNGPAVDIHIFFGAQLYKEIPSNTIPLYNHVICARGPGDAGYKLMGNGKLEKLPETLGFAIYQYGTANQKFKIYQHPFKRKTASRELEL